MNKNTEYDRGGGSERKEPFIIQFLAGILDFTGYMWDAVVAVPYKGVKFRNYHDRSFQKGIYNLQRRGMIRQTHK